MQLDADQALLAARFNPLQRAWVDFLLRFRLDWFCTFTFRDAVHPEAANKKLLYLLRALNRDVFGNNWQRRTTGIYWVAGIEYQRRGVLHFHGLLGAPENLGEKLRRLYWMEFWFRIAGIARIEQIDDHVLVAAYVSKYVAKGGEVELSQSLVAYCRQLNLPVAPIR